MARKHNTDRNGNAWTEQQKKAVWVKGTTIDGYDSNILHRDKCGKNMQYSEHGNRNSNNGWEIDHINPVANGGGDEIGNLQPLNWENNAKKGDTLNWRCGQ
jgi:5-methylcytosine-specific restriction endonuclease McrA